MVGLEQDMDDYNDMTTGGSDVDHLRVATRLLELKIKPVNTSIRIPRWFKVVDVSGQFTSLRCLIDDEYEDVNGINHSCALQVLLLTAFDYFDAGNDDVWCQKNNIDATATGIDDLLLGLKDFWQIYKTKISNPERIIDPYAWQINEGSAQTLRRLGKNNPEDINLSFTEM